MNDDENKSKLIDVNSARALAQSNFSLAFFDIDGTIVDASFCVSDATKSELALLHKSGTALALASGRPYFAARELIRELNITGPSVFYAGALVVEPQSGKRLLQRCLEHKLAKAVVAMARREDLYCEAYTPDNFFIERDSPYAAIHAQYLNRHPVITQLDGVIKSEQIFKFVFMSQLGENDEKLQRHLNGLSGANISRAGGAAHPGIMFSNVTSPLSSKKEAFECAMAANNKDGGAVIAFGDSEADMPFLTMADVGIAMGQSSDTVKAAAKFVTRPVSESGVAYALKVLREARQAH